MNLKRWLLIAPFLLTVFLLQSYLWVPTYEKQAVGNPDRLVTYIEGSIGDARLLNPILNADTASSSIVSQVFEGLLDLDENLKLRGRLATDWKIHEISVPNDGLKPCKKILINLSQDKSHPLRQINVDNNFNR